MNKIINTNVVAANAFISTGLDVLEKEKVEKYVRIVREKTNYKTNIFIGGFDISSFLIQFDFAFETDKSRKKIYVLKEYNSKKVLTGFFRINLPNHFIDILDKSGEELLEEIQNKEENKQKIYKK